MPLRAAELSFEKCLNQFPCEGVANHQASQAHHIEIIVLYALMRGKALMNQTGPDAVHFVSRD
jgi:hypothetical protein